METRSALVYCYKNILYSKTLTLSIQPDEDGKGCNESNSVIAIDPAVVHVMFPRKHGQFGGQGVWVLNCTTAHFLRLRGIADTIGN